MRFVLVSRVICTLPSGVGITNYYIYFFIHSYTSLDKYIFDMSTIAREMTSHVPACKQFIHKNS